MPPSSDDVRRTFIEYFRERGHDFVPSSPAVPLDDPTLLFTNAGMNQFKPIFLGQADPATPMGRLKRAVNSQKCIRAGGKHNDLEDVGKDTYHHTFFEMLGNWSFGDYFKPEAIEWSFDLLTRVFGIPAERLYATYFEGNPSAGLAPDDETRALWRRHLPDSHILPGSMKDNFWEMGETGPCGPCTEIHYDRIGGRNAAALVNTGDPDVLEIWNNVFIQFNRETEPGAQATGGPALRGGAPGGPALRGGSSSSPPPRPAGEVDSVAATTETGGGLPGTPPLRSNSPPTRLVPLPSKHVDTGMGLERLVSVLQKTSSNYDTDLFAPIFLAIERATGARPYRGRLAGADEGQVDTAYRVIADHIRTLTFAITDGAVPSNEGRGYVLRRILRRAVRYGRQMLNAKTGFFSALVPVVVDKMGAAFPELRRSPQRVIDILREEEESFGKTLDRGIGMFEEVAARGPIPAADAFKLYDTYGFPVDLTVLMAQERGLSVDVPGFEALMEQARERSRAGAKEGGSEELTLGPDAVARLRHMNVPPTDDSSKFPARDIRATVRAIWNGSDFDESARGDSLARVGLVLDQTNFYAEMGGQVADTGRIILMRDTRDAGPGAGSGEFKVESVKAYAGFVVHTGRVVRGHFRVGDDVQLHIDSAHRHPVQANHTATHLLNLALRKTLGHDADQKGSLVAPDRLRFDFAHSGPVAPDQLARAEAHVREQIERDLPVYAELAPLAAARAINGLRAVFGEAYPDPVRVVSIGRPVADLLAHPDNPAWRDYSVEFCGGTHLASTSAAAEFCIVSEEAVAKGVRRIVALTGTPARAARAAAAALRERVAHAASLPLAELQSESQAVATEIDALTLPAAERAALRASLALLSEKIKAGAKQAEGEKRKAAAEIARRIAESALTAGDEVIVTVIELGSERPALEEAVKTIRDRCPRSAVMLLSPDESDPANPRVSVMAAVPDALVKKGLRAGDWVRETAAVVGGKGGGRPDQAQGGGADVAKIKDAVALARKAALAKVMG
ncbi:MAG: alanine--tRNA ligase [Phycisphaerales bacterium]|nr:alanine--tRNA ligase [Phycisphaerales bacterium]